MADDMTVPMILGLIAGIFVLIINILVVAAGALVSSVPLAGKAVGGIVMAMGVWGLVVGILLIVGSMLMRNPAQAKMGSILVLIFGILAFFTSGFGLVIFPILAIVGGALGLSKSK